MLQRVLAKKGIEKISEGEGGPESVHHPQSQPCAGQAGTDRLGLEWRETCLCGHWKLTSPCGVWAQQLPVSQGVSDTVCSVRGWDGGVRW